MTTAQSFFIEVTEQDGDDDHINFGGALGFIQMQGVAERLGDKIVRHMKLRLDISEDASELEEAHRLDRCQVEDDYVQFSGTLGFLQVQLSDDSAWMWLKGTDKLFLNFSVV